MTNQQCMPPQGINFHPPPVSMMFILQLDPDKALRENFDIRDFTLSEREKDVSLTYPFPEPENSSHFKLPPFKVRESSESRRAWRVPRSGKVAVELNGDSHPEDREEQDGGFKDEHVEQGEEVEEGGARDLLLLAAGEASEQEAVEEEAGEVIAWCPVCHAYSTNLASELGAHLSECLSVPSTSKKQQKSRGKKKTRLLQDVLTTAAYSKNQVRGTSSAAAAHAKRKSPVESHMSELVTEALLADVSRPSGPATEPVGNDGSESVVPDAEPVDTAPEHLTTEASPVVHLVNERPVRKRVSTVAKKSADFISEPLKKKRRRDRTKAAASELGIPSCKGVRGKWAAEIRDVNKNSRLWLRTHGSPEEAGVACNEAFERLRGEASQVHVASDEPVHDEGKELAIIEQMISSDHGVPMDTTPSSLEVAPAIEQDMQGSPVAECKNVSTEARQEDKVDTGVEDKSIVVVSGGLAEDNSMVLVSGGLAEEEGQGHESVTMVCAIKRNTPEAPGERRQPKDGIGVPVPVCVVSREVALPVELLGFGQLDVPPSKDGEMVVASGGRRRKKKLKTKAEIKNTKRRYRKRLKEPLLSSPDGSDTPALLAICV